MAGGSNYAASATSGASSARRGPRCVGRPSSIVVPGWGSAAEHTTQSSSHTAVNDGWRCKGELYCHVASHHVTCNVVPPFAGLTSMFPLYPSHVKTGLKWANRARAAMGVTIWTHGGGPVSKTPSSVCCSRSGASFACLSASGGAETGKGEGTHCPTWGQASGFHSVPSLRTEPRAEQWDGECCQRKTPQVHPAEYKDATHIVA